MSKRSADLYRILGSCRAYFGSAAAFSLAINLLYLSSPIYMLQVYDRVVSSGSEVTLMMLTIALLLAYVALAGLDAVRARILARATVRLDLLIAPHLVTAMAEQATDAGGARGQLLRDFDRFRQFLTGAGIHALFDAPWAPIYIAVIFLLHPALGAFALACAALLIMLALLNEWLVRRPLGEANAASTSNYGFTETWLRNAEVVRAMGMTQGILRRWARDRYRMLDRQAVASNRAAAVQSVIRFLRLSMQSVILGLGAWLVIERSATAGVMFAASLLLGRALQPVEQVVGSWRSLVLIRSAYLRVHELLATHPRESPGLSLPRPQGRLRVEGLTCVPPGHANALLRGVSFELEPGEVLGVIGPAGAGKSTLARHLVGALIPTSGAVRLDGADVSVWVRSNLGRHLGYLPQDIELFSDTVAANISRFQSGEDEATIRAASLAGVHELILRLPKGYDTSVGEGGTVISAGLRQRLALARAVYGEPGLVVLDEPSSNLDADGDMALADCITQLKQRRVSVVLISHRPSTIRVVDKILVLRNGLVELFGTRADVLARLAQPRTPVPAVRVVS